MFSPAVRVGTRLKDWKMKPMRSRRSLRQPGIIELRDVLIANEGYPEVGVSRPAMQCMRVDLPDPDGPITAVNRPPSNSTLTPASAVTRRHLCHTS